MTDAKRKLPIRVGDAFQSDGEVWTVFEVGSFGRPHWVVSADRRRQTMFHRNVLDTMTRVNAEVSSHD